MAGPPEAVPYRSVASRKKPDERGERGKKEEGMGGPQLLSTGDCSFRREHENTTKGDHIKRVFSSEHMAINRVGT